MRVLGYTMGRGANREFEISRALLCRDESEAWVYFRGPDGYLYELWQTARPSKEN